MGHGGKGRRRGRQRVCTPLGATLRNLPFLSQSTGEPLKDFGLGRHHQVWVLFRRLSLQGGKWPGRSKGQDWQVAGAVLQCRNACSGLLGAVTCSSPELSSHTDRMASSMQDFGEDQMTPCVRVWHIVCIINGSDYLVAAHGSIPALALGTIHDPVIATGAGNALPRPVSGPATYSASNPGAWCWLPSDVPDSGLSLQSDLPGQQLTRGRVPSLPQAVAPSVLRNTSLIATCNTR